MYFFLQWKLTCIIACWQMTAKKMYRNEYCIPYWLNRIKVDTICRSHFRNFSKKTPTVTSEFWSMTLEKSYIPIYSNFNVYTWPKWYYAYECEMLEISTEILQFNGAWFAEYIKWILNMPLNLELVLNFI